MFSVFDKLLYKPKPQRDWQYELNNSLINSISNHTQSIDNIMSMIDVLNQRIRRLEEQR